MITMLIQKVKLFISPTSIIFFFSSTLFVTKCFKKYENHFTKYYMTNLNEFNIL